MLYEVGNLCLERCDIFGILDWQTEQERRFGRCWAKGKPTTSDSQRMRNLPNEGRLIVTVATLGKGSREE